MTGGQIDPNRTVAGGRLRGATRLDQELLRFVTGYLDANDGISPSMREISRALGFKSASSIPRVLARLVDRGAIRRLPHRTRAIEVLRRPEVPRGPDGVPLYFVPIRNAPVHGVQHA